MNNTTTQYSMALETSFEHVLKGELVQAESICRQILEVEPDISEALHVVALILARRNDLEGARQAIERAVEINPREAAYLNTFGGIAGLLGEREKAWQLYEKSIQANPEYSKSYNNMGVMLMEEERFGEAIELFSQSIRVENDNVLATGNRGIAAFELLKRHCPDKFFPEGFSPAPNPVNTASRLSSQPWIHSYIYCPFYHFVYAPVPKVACSSLKTLILALLRDLVPQLPTFTDSDEEQVHFHLFMDNLNSMARFHSHESNEILLCPDIFKFTFVRNPFHRIASAYLNKFVTERTNSNQWLHTRPTFESIYGEETDLLRDSVSFRQFIGYLCSARDADLDKHFAPMHQIVKIPLMNFVGRLETIEQDYATLRERLALPAMALPHLNRSPRSTSEVARGELADTGNDVLSTLPTLPTVAQLYDKELEHAVLSRYKRDFEDLGYEQRLLQ